jgi:hypothetical protein
VQEGKRGFEKASIREAVINKASWHCPKKLASGSTGTVVRVLQSSCQCDCAGAEMRDFPITPQIRFFTLPQPEQHKRSEVDVSAAPVSITYSHI